MLPQTTKLLQLMQQASGYTPDEILDGCRKSPLPALRWFIGEELMALGYSSVIAARELNIDHSTLLYGRKQIEDKDMMDRNGWRREFAIYVRFKKLINADKQ